MIFRTFILVTFYLNFVITLLFIFVCRVYVEFARRV
jgi:hypothetical protein